MTRDLEPVVIVGGFGSHWSDYMQGAQALQRVSGRRVFVADVKRYTWAMATVTGYGLLLNLTHRAVERALQQTGASKVILVGHSAGGVIARAYLAHDLNGMEAAQRRGASLPAYSGHTRVRRFIALGSPLRTPARIPAGRKPLQYIAWLDAHYPGSFYAPDVEYLSVYGRTAEGVAKGATYQRVAHYYYEFLDGNGSQWGDGVVPNVLSRADGIPSLELEGMGHSPLARWYLGDEASIRRWWHYFDVGDAPVLPSDIACA